RRGIFEIPVYRARLQMQGRFLLPEPEGLAVAITDLDFTRAELVIGIAHPGGLAADGRVELGGQALRLEPAAQSLGSQGVHARVARGIAVEELARGVAFDIELSLNGSSALYVAPVGRQTTLGLHGD